MKTKLTFSCWALLLTALTLTLSQIRLADSSNKPLIDIDPIQDSDFYNNGEFSSAQVRLGQLLFFDKILSGNKNIACSTCHHPNLGTSDAVSLSLGEGAAGIGRERRADPQNPVLGRIPRNAQSLYFLGAKEYRSMFHDGRVEEYPNSRWQSKFWTPAREQLPPGLDNVLAAQAMFPVLSHIEMAGHKGENEIATAVALDKLDGPDGAWALLAKRLQGIPEYVGLFQATFADINHAGDITFVHAANAIAVFEAASFRPDQSPFDRYLQTRDAEVLNPAAQRGMKLFYGAAGCGDCHSGKFQTDQQFHATAMPQVGPGKNDGWDQSYWQATGFMARLEDHGRGRVTQRSADNYKFRTPSLRNVELTGPWGHAGTFQSLAEVIRYHVNPAVALQDYTIAEAQLPELDNIVEPTAIGSELIFRPVNPRRLQDYLRRDGWVLQTPQIREAIAAANEIEAIRLSDKDIDNLVEFLKALTDPRSRDRSDLIPQRVPSGLPVDA